LLSIDHDPDTVDVLLAYLPSAADEDVAKEVRAALAALASSTPETKQKLAKLTKSSAFGLHKTLSALLDPTSDSAAYRVYPAGVKFAMKGTKLRDGKKTWEWEVTEVRFFNSLPSALFDRP
jgi:hypothetical protein